MTTDHRPHTLAGEVSAMRRPDLVRAVDGEIELRLVLSVRRFRDGWYDGRDYHHIVVRSPGTNTAVSYAAVVRPGTRLHVHGAWRTRTDHTGTYDELVVTRLYTPLPIPAGTPAGKPREGERL